MLIAAAAAVHTVADDSSPAAMMARIEGAQSPNRQGLDPLTLQQLMVRSVSYTHLTLPTIYSV